MSLKNSYTRALKIHASDVFCDHSPTGLLCVFRHVKRFVPVVVDENFKLFNLIRDKELIFALTDNWSPRGIPRAWGIDRVVERLREIDTQARADFYEQIDRENEKVDESKDRSLMNEAEAFFKDKRREFVKTFDEHVGSRTSLPKDETIKRKRYRSI